MNEASTAALAFLEEMTPRVQDAVRVEEHKRRNQGTGFSIADYAVHGFEVYLNRIICDLLEPRGPHGQGPKFLQLFLDVILPDLALGDPQDWNVRLNHRTAKGRYVDIALFRRPDITIYIESKPWAGESDKQLEDYAYDLISLKCCHKRLLFLPGTSDRNPQTLTVQTLELLGEQFVCVPFQHCETAPSIAEWLEQCAKACEADNVRTFIRDLADYLQRQFPSPEAKYMSEDRFVTDVLPIIRANKSYMATAFKVARLVDELKRNLAVAFFQDLEAELLRKNPGWVVTNDFKNVASGEQLFCFRAPSWPGEWSICLERRSAVLEGKSVFRNFCIGFRCPPDSIDRRNEATANDHVVIRGALEEPLRAIGNLQKSKWWPAYCWLPSPFYPVWRDEAFMLISGDLMPDGRTALELFAGWFESLTNAIESKIAEIQSGRIPGSSA